MLYGYRDFVKVHGSSKRIFMLYIDDMMFWISVIMKQVGNDTSVIFLEMSPNGFMKI